MRPTLAAALLLLTTLPACDRGDGLTTTQRQTRRDAVLGACIAEELLVEARSRLASLDTLLMQSTTADMLRAPHEFARVYATFADVRAHETAYVDSAYRAGSSADSARFTRQAASFRISTPPPGSVEANVAEQYARDFQRARGNAYHPCNVQLREKEGERR
ncbi:MAG TPA: hypothetical protein VFQ45_01710 [Longimicrobium sp.]|nr:hypothetical protein [Longimicrobium sp.]